MKIAVLVVIFAALSTDIAAQEPRPRVEREVAAQTSVERELAIQAAVERALAPCRATGAQILTDDEGKKIEEAKKEFEALGFGGGYGAVVNLDDEPRIAEAEVVNGFVRVQEDDNVQFGPVMEMHKFNWALRTQTLAKVGDNWVLVDELPGGCVPTGAVLKKVPLIGAGPFVTLRLGGEEVVQSFGLGLIFGFRKAESDRSLNFGVAYVTDPNVKLLGDGIEANKALPTGETQIRYKTTNQYGLMVMFSVGW